ncbi:MAG TPA: phosphoglycerate dehydrogenase [Alphaproteobacteria bacterium]|jgi:D-3-phosphoglycerate dehydrogenase|nr:phosphoglycerate dehydrogenase [Alphaproteobacteria bacterium]MDP6269396.1 phosphoglycerate dehydrogenase [Alphaproteobacteria bacterium]MDP7428913.1 phosphoglycerate dehydrogenase [Alphaproteobacteria bacterium]HJM50046.1 phosphoglycerate dehydrogenase [Alphaproteobacteria bacterium]
MVKVLISDEMSPNCAQVFRDRGVEVDEKVGLAPEELAAVIGEYDGLAVRSASMVTADIIAAAGRLKVVGRAGIGVDNIDVPAATDRGIVVMNTPFGNAITTAEHTIALMLSLARQIPEASRSTHDGKWEKSRFMGVEVAGKVLGLVGCGNIGAIVADRAQGLKMTVMSYDPFLSPERAESLGLRKVELDELFARADFITLHTPLTEQTRGIIDAGAMAQMKTGVRIINCARGGLVVEADLKAALDSGQVAGAALDVYEEEPARQNALFGLDNVVATPHLGASTTEAQEKVAVQVAEQMSEYLLKGAVANALNMPSVSAEDAPKLKPYMQLADQLGRFAGQITESGLKAVTIEYAGQVATLNTKPLTAMVLAGLLTPLMDSVNMVNAPSVAKERGIEISELTHETSPGYQTLIRLSVTSERRQRSVAGTLFSDQDPRLVEVNGIKLEATLAPRMLFLMNEDKPGTIGNVGNTLGAAGVNVATFHLGRAQPGGDALSLIEIDDPISDDLLRQLGELPNVRQAKALKF